ncbi:MAG TPA: hypothetical protein PK156_25725 [Polyangium sp.]|nr:hypothetical protein [Polyangium sp.]
MKWLRMTEDELRDGPDGLTALVMGVMGAVWVCISASGIGWGHCVMLVLCIAPAMIVRAKHPSWWPFFSLGLALYAPILAGAIYFGIHEAWDFPLATNSCGHRWVFSPATLWVHGLLVLAVVGLAASYLCLLAARYLVGNARLLLPILRLCSVGHCKRNSTQL